MRAFLIASLVVACVLGSAVHAGATNKPNPPPPVVPPVVVVPPCPYPPAGKDGQAGNDDCVPPESPPASSPPLVVPPAVVVVERVVEKLVTVPGPTRTITKTRTVRVKSPPKLIVRTKVVYRQKLVCPKYTKLYKGTCAVMGRG